MEMEMTGSRLPRRADSTTGRDRSEAVDGDSGLDLVKKR